MAKSKSGGTRAMIRGRVGSDVYSVGRDASGKKQQVVRSIAESVANPQTVSQMRGRMIMSTVMQALSALRDIVDHSFDNVTGVQPNLSEFIRLNYAAIKADVAAHPASGNAFGLVVYGGKGAARGQYIVASGRASVPAAASFNQATGALSLNLTGAELTLAGLKSALGLGAEEYITIVGLTTDGKAQYARVHINYSLADSTAIASANLNEVLNIVGNVAPAVALNGNVITITIADIATCGAIIVTRKSNDGFIHSNAQLGEGVDFENASAVALPTYPVGEQKFLNGGAEAATASGSPSNPEDGEEEPPNLGG